MVIKDLLAGAFAGFAVDTMLYPIDTLKTRMQSSQGFYKSGGFRGIYKGFGSAAAGSMPGAALFFTGYEFTRKNFTGYGLAGEIIASSVGEITACLARCPTEIIKQRAQIGERSSFQVLRDTLRSGGIPALYKGYFTLVGREIPFACIQMPLWQYLKLAMGSEGNPFYAGLAGSISGAIAAAATTPIDVAKTRIMTDESKDKPAGLWETLKRIYRTQGISGCFAGVVPRVTWITIGGFIFLGGYDMAGMKLAEAGLT